MVGLYPALLKKESAEEGYQAIMEADISWEGGNWKEGVRFIILNRSQIWCETSKLGRLLPYRRYKHGTRPGVTGKGPMGPEADDEFQWVFRNLDNIITMDKRMIVAEIVKIGIETMYSTHMCSFGGNTYKQTDGGPIGLRSMCALAHVIMSRWDIKWKNCLKENNIMTEGNLGPSVVVSLAVVIR